MPGAQNGGESFTSSGPNWASDFNGGHDGWQLTSTGGGGGGAARGAGAAEGAGAYPTSGRTPPRCAAHRPGPGRLPPVQGTWHNEAILATNALYTITNGANTLATTTVNQAVAPSGTIFDSVPFQNFTVVHVTTGTLDVVLTDNANGAGRGRRDPGRPGRRPRLVVPDRPDLRLGGVDDHSPAVVHRLRREPGDGRDDRVLRLAQRDARPGR